MPQRYPGNLKEGDVVRHKGKTCCVHDSGEQIPAGDELDIIIRIQKNI